MSSVYPEVQAQADLTAYGDPPALIHGDDAPPYSSVGYPHPSYSETAGTSDEDVPPPLPERNYCSEDLGLEDAPPLPQRNYSWSDLEDNDDEALGDNSEDDYVAVSPLGDKVCHVRGSERQKGWWDGGRFFGPREQGSLEKARPTMQPYRAEDLLPRNKADPISRSKEGAEPKQGRARREEGLPDVDIKRTSSSSKSKKERRLLERMKKKTDKEREIRLKQEEKKKSKEMEALRRGKSQKKKERKRYFGSPLEAVAGENGVPMFVQQCVTIVEQDLCTEGLYRISGGKDDVLYLQEQFDEDTNMDVKLLEAKVAEFCYVITSAVKNYFRLLPEPLISNPVADKLLKIKDMTPTLQAASTKEILSALPEANKKTLYFMCCHLHRVSLSASSNKMNSSNLAIVFWPTLMRPSLDDLVDQGKHLCWQVVMNQMINDPELVPH